ARPSTSPLTTTSTLKILWWSGPDSPDTRYSGSGRPSACTRSCSADLWSCTNRRSLPPSIASLRSRRTQLARGLGPPIEISRRAERCVGVCERRGLQAPAGLLLAAPEQQVVAKLDRF